MRFERTENLLSVQRKSANIQIGKAQSAQHLPESGYKSTFEKVLGGRAGEFIIDNLLVRITLILEMTSVDRPRAMGV